MAFAYLAEFPDLRINQGTPSPGVEMPPIASSTVAIGAGSVQSAAHNTKCRLLGISTDAVCSVEFGTNPTATASSFRLPANSISFWRVQPGNRVAVITNT
jgi:hypothetical protein